MSSISVKNVLVVGAGGNVGKSTVKALLAEGFQVTGLIREASEASLPPGVRLFRSDYSEASLLDAFKGQDAIISTVSGIAAGGNLSLQKFIIDAAIVAGVKIFFPSEYGVDTSDPSAPEYIPFLVDKLDTVNYLKARQDDISWTALITGSIFDWGFRIPGFGGWDIPARTATIFDGGDISYEATNLDQVGRAIAKCLEKPELTRNQYVYVNSFTVTQNLVLKAIEGATKEKFTLSSSTVQQLWSSGASSVKEGQPLGVLSQIAGTIYGKGGLANYSTNKGLWNEKLGLAQENLEEFLREYVADN